MGAIAVAHASHDGEARVRRMLDSVPHRGDGIRLARLNGSALGVRTRSDAPDAWVATRGTRAAAIAGTIDDLAAIASELGIAACDPAETTLAAFEAWGEDALRRLRGSFAAAILDGASVSCFRDRFGTAPLFWGRHAGGVYAGTEPKQVVAGAGISREPDLEGLERTFFGGAGDETAIRGVHRLPRASLISSRAGSEPAVRRYWDPSDLVETASMDVDEAVERLVQILERAVRRRLGGADAVLLSGGVDSPTVAAFAARLAPAGSLRAVSAVYPDHPSVDEQPYIEMVARHLGIPLHTYVPQATSLEDVQTWVDLLDGPVNTISIPLVAEAYRAAAQAGARTIITGEVEEYALEVRQFLLDHLLAHGRWRALAAEISSRRRNGRTWGAVLRALVRPLLPPRAALALAPLRPNPNPNPPWIDEGRIEWGSRRDHLERRRRDRWRVLQPAPLFGHVMSFEADEMCAALCGVRVGWPFADIELWEFLLSLPAETKFPDAVPKALLRRAMRGVLPDAILDRRDKTVFNEYSLARADYPALRKWILTTPHRISGVDYALLSEGLEREDLGVYELRRARDLARVHAFLALW